jgi:hypothetical protein
VHGQNTVQPVSNKSGQWRAFAELAHQQQKYSCSNRVAETAEEMFFIKYWQNIYCCFIRNSQSFNRGFFVSRDSPV